MVSVLFRQKACQTICETTRILNISMASSRAVSTTGFGQESSLNPRLLTASYAVRGEIAIRADAIQKELAEGKKFPFPSLTLCNIGNPQALKQKPLTFTRQVMSLIEYPELMNRNTGYPKDVIDRAKSYLAEFPTGTGAYSNSKGSSTVRKEVAKFIEQRDGYPADVESIFLTDGASEGVQNVLNTLIGSEKDGFLIPIPQYPLYSALIPLLGGSSVPYYLDEEKQWGLTIDELERAYEEGVKKGVKPKGLVVINPGNPTGQCITAQNIKDIIKFCNKHSILIMADEVYQENSYYKDELPFVSFRKMLLESPSPINNTSLISFHSISKGITGECGKRGGYFEVINMHPDFITQIYKRSSIALCSNLTGQFGVGLMTNPPKPGDPSHDLYKTERDALYNSLRNRSIKLVKSLNKLEGVTCNRVDGAMYAFPRIRLPEKFVKEAESQKKEPDMVYCIRLLEETGICTVPGSGFLQAPGTYHFRTTFLPPEEQLEASLQRMEVFHSKFMNQYK